MSGPGVSPCGGRLDNAPVRGCNGRVKIIFNYGEWRGQRRPVPDDAISSSGCDDAGPLVLTALHQFPGHIRDARAGMVEVLAREVAKAGVRVAIAAGGTPLAPAVHWDALANGELDISSLALDEASRQQPLLSATLMPGLVRSRERAARLNRSAFMGHIKAIIDAAGAIVLADAWLPGVFAAKRDCIRAPCTVRGLRVRGPGPAFAQMLKAAGAVSVALPSSDIYQALRDGRLDAAIVSLETLISFRLFEQAKFVTVPGALCFTYQPVLMSKQAFGRLNDVQRDALLAAGRVAEAYFDRAARRDDRETIAALRQAGAQVIEMPRDDYCAWLAVARRSAYRNFAFNVRGGDELIGSALSVD